MQPTIYVIACASCFLAGALFPLLFLRKKISTVHIKAFFSNLGTINLILIILGISIFAFVLKMVQLFEMYGTVPDTLITCFFAVVGGECGVMGWIRTNKENNKMRKWQLEDQKREAENQKK